MRALRLTYSLGAGNRRMASIVPAFCDIGEIGDIGENLDLSPGLVSAHFLQLGNGCPPAPGLHHSTGPVP